MDIKHYIKNIAKSASSVYAMRSLYVSLCQSAERPTYNQRERGSRSCLLLGGLDKSRHIVFTVLLVRVERSRKDQNKAVEGPSIRHIVFSMITRSYSRRRRRLLIFKS